MTCALPKMATPSSATCRTCQKRCKAKKPTQVEGGALFRGNNRKHARTPKGPAQPPKLALRYPVPVPKVVPHKRVAAPKRRLTLFAIQSLVDSYKSMYPAAVWRGHCIKAESFSGENNNCVFSAAEAEELQVFDASLPTSSTRSWLRSQGLTPLNNPVRRDCWWTSHEALGGAPVAKAKEEATRLTGKQFHHPRMNEKQISDAVAGLKDHYPAGLLIAHEPGEGFFFLIHAWQERVVARTQCG